MRHHALYCHSVNTAIIIENPQWVDKYHEPAHHSQNVNVRVSLLPLKQYDQRQGDTHLVTPVKADIPEVKTKIAGSPADSENLQGQHNGGENPDQLLAEAPVMFFGLYDHNGHDKNHQQ